MLKEPKKLKKIRAAHKLLYQDEINFYTFEQIRKLLKGLNPKIDQTLKDCSKAYKNLIRIQRKNVIHLSLKNIPTKTEKDKERKKALLLFLKYFRKLKNEIKRLEKQIKIGKKDNSFSERSSNTSRFITTAKGPFGIITITALIIVGGIALINKTTNSNLSQPQQTNSQNQVNDSNQLIDDSILSYWIEEVTAEPQGNKIIWGVHLHKQDDNIRAKEEHVPAIGAQVTLQLHSVEETKELTGIVTSEGWVYWTEPKPKTRTTAAVLDIVGDLPWADSDRNKWQGNTAVTFSP